MMKNLYEREKLYEEVWSDPVTKVAIPYGVSDVAIRKVCKSLCIPLPPRGYWAKLRAGKEVMKEPLPDSYTGFLAKIGKRTVTPQDKHDRQNE